MGMPNSLISVYLEYWTKLLLLCLVPMMFFFSPCRIDANGVIKVADFGLTEDIYQSNYFHQDSSSMKLPVKWMAPESIHDRLFTEKSDVVWQLLQSIVLRSGAICRILMQNVIRGDLSDVCVFHRLYRSQRYAHWYVNRYPVLRFLTAIVISKPETAEAKTYFLNAIKP